MSNIELIPSVKRNTFRLHTSNESIGDLYRKNRPLVLQRDKFSCQGCGFSIRFDKTTTHSPISLEYSKYLTVHHINDNHDDDSIGNLITLCPFCHNVFHCGCAGYKNEAKVIFFPWLSQSEINIMCNLIVSTQAMHKKDENGHPYYEDASMLYALLDEFHIYTDKLLASGADNAGKLGTAIMTAYYQNKETYSRRGEFLAGFRLLPLIDSFQHASNIWCNEWPNSIEWEMIGDQWTK